MNSVSINSKALAAFETLYPRLLGVVRERYSLRLGKSTPELDRRKRELLEDCVGRFGDTLKAVYSFGLFEELENKTAWLVSVIESRGLSRKWADIILETWAIAIQGLVRPPEGDELIRPLILARSLVSRPARPAPAGEGKPPEDVQRYLDYAIGARYQVFDSETNAPIGHGGVIAKAPYLGRRNFRTEDDQERFDTKYTDVILRLEKTEANIPLGLSVVAVLPPVPGQKK